MVFTLLRLVNGLHALHQVQCLILKFVFGVDQRQRVLQVIRLSNFAESKCFVAAIIEYISSRATVAYWERFALGPIFLQNYLVCFHKLNFSCLWRLQANHIKVSACGQGGVIDHHSLLSNFQLGGGILCSSSLSSFKQLSICDGGFVARLVELLFLVSFTTRLVWICLFAFARWVVPFA